MPCDIRIVSTYPPRRCGIGTFSRDLATALAHFTAEIGHIRIAAIDNGSGPYDIPVDLTIDQYSPQSWRDAITHISTDADERENPTVVILQHEYGLDPDDQGNDCRGTNFVRLAEAFQERQLTTLVYLHTVLDEPDAHQKQVVQDLAGHSDGLIVTTESAIQILESPTYEIPHAQLKHIDHGIRMQHRSQFDRLTIKREYGLENRFLITTLGLLSPDKGIDYGIRAYGRFLEESCTQEQRKKMVYVIAGQCHPDLDCFIDENTLLQLYGATNVMLLPYQNMQQISSGILADTLGSGRVAITTKFRYARELIHSNKKCPEGVIVGRYARGILVDPGEPCVEQIAQAIDYLVFNEGKRIMMERQAHQRGYQMRWNNSAWALLQYIDFVREQKEIITGRGVKFTGNIHSRGHHTGAQAGSETMRFPARRLGPMTQQLIRILINSRAACPERGRRNDKRPRAFRNSYHFEPILTGPPSRADW